MLGGDGRGRTGERLGWRRRKEVTGTVAILTIFDHDK